MRSDEYNAWAPGLRSSIPASLLPEVTLFRNEVSTVDYVKARELADFCGLKSEQLMVFRPQRLVIHELLVKVTCDLFVPDGPNYEDLGISLRSMVASIYQNYLLPEMPSLQQAHDSEVNKAQIFIDNQIGSRLFSRAEPAPQSGSLLTRWFKRTPKPTAPSEDPLEPAALSEWRRLLAEGADSHQVVCLNALDTTVTAVIRHRGRLVNQPELLAEIAVGLASNEIGNNLIATMVEPIFNRAVIAEGFKKLPLQTKPVVMNVKGASASGKSSIRQQQRELAEKLDIPWHEFAVISPDYWRKYLLDYSSVGEHFKYAAMLTGQELALIDAKLDRYMERKASLGEIPHLLIDRFRFDSFSVEKGRSHDSRLLSRFGDQIFLFFMITPPAETVERAWERGKTTGRYKSVDDLLYHNVEAYTGMPELFLSWVMSDDKRVRFEFLDNNVPKGNVPKTVAFGCNHELNILDFSLMQNIDRYRKINIDATTPEQVFQDLGLEDTNEKFISRCIASIKTVRFADQNSALVSVVFKDGKLHWIDQEILDKHKDCDRIKTFLRRFEMPGEPEDACKKPCSIDLHVEKQQTLGCWAV